ncbi:MAG: hypothetical protein QOI40_4982 [Alphaproteobacteria bacterium]|jgi:hypothetical protein|nr:hypothetical protein [Alphaproteobacteria bacterium]
MKMVTGTLAAAALLASLAVGNAQDKSQKMDEQAGGNSQAVERNPNGAPAGSKANPSPTTGAGGMSSGNAGSTTKQDESAGGANGAVERNPNGSTGGSKSNPSR